MEPPRRRGRVSRRDMKSNAGLLANRTPQLHEPVIASPHLSAAPCLTSSQQGMNGARATSQPEAHAGQTSSLNGPGLSHCGQQLPPCPGLYTQLQQVQSGSRHAGVRDCTAVGEKSPFQRESSSLITPPQDCGGNGGRDAGSDRLPRLGFLRPSLPIQDKQRGATVPERLISMMRHPRERIWTEIRAHQLMDDDDEEGRGQKQKKGTRGPLSEGNRPRGMWSLKNVQYLALESLAAAGLNLFDENGQLRKDPKSGKPYKKLQNGFAEDSRDHIENLLRSEYSEEPCVIQLMEEASEDGHFLNPEVVRRQLVRFLDRILQHMRALDEEPDRLSGDWRVRLEDRHKAFILAHIDEFCEYISEEDRLHPSQHVRYTHFDEFIKKHKGHLPCNITAAYLRMFLNTLVDQELPLEVWAKHTVEVKKMMDERAGRDGSSLPDGWATPTAAQLVNIVRMSRRHPLRRPDVRLEFKLSAANPFSQHHGLSVASIDKIEDGRASPGYRIFLPGYEEVLAQYEADPDGFYMTFDLVRRIGNIQLSILFDNLAKGDGDFRLYAAYMVEVGQFVLHQYASYFTLSVEEAQKDVDIRLAQSRTAVEKNEDDRTDRESWFGRQMKRVKGSRTRTKGRQLRHHVSLEHLREMYAYQKRSCHYTGETVILARGGKYSPHAACLELVGPSRTFKFASSWIARGFGAAPLTTRKDFLTYWGVEGHTYVAYLRQDSLGTTVDPYEEKCSQILGQDSLGEVLGRAGSGEDKGKENNVASAKSVKTAPDASALLPFGGFDCSWGSRLELLEELSEDQGPPASRYRRAGGLRSDGAPPLMQHGFSGKEGDEQSPQEGASGAPAPAHAFEAASRPSKLPIRRPVGLALSDGTRSEGAPPTNPRKNARGQSNRRSGQEESMAMGRCRLPSRFQTKESRILDAPNSAFHVSAHGKSPEGESSAREPRVHAEVPLQGIGMEASDGKDLKRAGKKDPRFPYLPAYLPPGSSRAVKLTALEMSRLEPGSWLCTEIVSFYCSYLLSNETDVIWAEPWLYDRLQKLANCKSLMGAAKFEEQIFRAFRSHGIKELFTAKLIFIPIYTRLHFSLVIMRNPGAPGGFMLHLDSLEGHHAGIESTLRRALEAAWTFVSVAAEPSGLAEHREFTRSTFLFLPIPVPQQPTSCDCALFMLHNLEVVLKDRSLVERMNILEDVQHLYDPADAMKKRQEIHDLICALACTEAPAREEVLSGSAGSSPSVLSPKGKRVAAPLPAESTDAGLLNTAPKRPAAPRRPAAPQHVGGDSHLPTLDVQVAGNAGSITPAVSERHSQVKERAVKDSGAFSAASLHPRITPSWARDAGNNGLVPTRACSPIFHGDPRPLEKRRRFNCPFKGTK